MEIAQGSKIILQLPISSEMALQALVETCLKRSVVLIAVVGEGSSKIEDEIDWMIIGDGSDPDRFITTSSHEDETIDDVLNFCRHFDNEEDAKIISI